MPRGNGTGPNGMGPSTGRGAGYCEGYPTPGYMNLQGGRGGMGRGQRGSGGGRGGGRGGGGGGRGMGRGGGRGWRHGQAAMAPWAGPAYPPAPYEPAMGREQELNMLRRHVETLEGTLDRVKQQIQEIESQESE